MIASALIFLVAALHLYFLVLEMFLWTKPTGLRTFRMSLQKAKDSAVLAANQGLYNGFLAAGLVWSRFSSDPQFSTQLSIFFLGCVIAAALYGAYSLGRKILWIQGFPALLGMIAVLIGI